MHYYLVQFPNNSSITPLDIPRNGNAKSIEFRDGTGVQLAGWRRGRKRDQQSGGNSGSEDSADTEAGPTFQGL